MKVLHQEGPSMIFLLLNSKLKEQRFECLILLIDLQSLTQCLLGVTMREEHFSRKSK